MPTDEHFRLRWKGAVTGPFPLARVQEMLRSGEISLLHGIEVDGRWLTVRDYLRGTGLRRTGVHAETVATPASPYLPEHAAPGLTPAQQRDAAGEALERNVRAGYLWCGSTFLLPPLFSSLVLLLAFVLPETPRLSLFVLGCFTIVAGAFLPLHFVAKVGRRLDHDGLSEIRQAQSRLTMVLALLSILVWTASAWILTHPKP